MRVAWRRGGLLLLLLAIILPLSAAKPSHSATQTWPQTTSDIPADPAVVWRVLPNGMRYALMQNAQPPGAVSMRLSVELGSLDEADSERGLAHFIEHMAFNGTTHVPEGELVPALERLGLTFGADTNATTGRKFTTYMLDLPSSSSAAVDTGFFLLREIAGELTFGAAAVERERGVIAAETRKADTFEKRSSDQQLAFLTPGAYAAQRPPLGDSEIVESATRAQLNSLYERFYRPENMTLIIVGDFDVAAMEARVVATFGAWSGRGEAGKRPDTTYHLSGREPAALVIPHPEGGDAISVFSLTPIHDRADTWEARHDDVLVSMATGAINRRLAEAANGPNPSFLRAGLFWSDLLEAADFASGSVAIMPGDWKAGLQALEQEWRRAREFGFTQSEIDQQIAVVRTALANAAERADTRATPALAASLTASLQDGSVFSSPAAFRDQFERWAPDVTKEAVSAAFRDRMAVATPLVVMISSIPEAPTSDDLVAAWAASARTPISAYAPAGKAAFPYTDFGLPGRVIKDEGRPELGARLITFENNVRLNLRKTTLQKGSVLVSLRIGEGGVALEKAPFGLARLMNAYGAGGLEALSADDLERTLAGHTVQAGLLVSADAFGGVYATTPQDLQLQLQLAAAYMIHPGYRPEAERDWRQSIILGWPGLNKDAQAAFASRGTRWLARGDMRFGAAPDDGVIARSFGELKSYLAPIFEDASIEIAIVGDVDETAAVQAVAATFGALARRRRDPGPVRSAIPVAFEQGSLVLVHGGEASQALLKMYWPVDIPPDADPQTARVLGFVASVMRLKLVSSARESLGASYAPAAGFSSSTIYPGLNYIFAELELRPSDLDKIEAVVQAIANEMRNGDITDDELERARAPALEQLPQHAASNAYWLSMMAQAQGRPERTEHLDLDAIASGLRSVTISDLIAASSHWLDADNLRIVRVVPAGPAN